MQGCTPNALQQQQQQQQQQQHQLEHSVYLASKGLLLPQVIFAELAAGSASTSDTSPATKRTPASAHCFTRCARSCRLHTCP